MGILLIGTLIEFNGRHSTSYFSNSSQIVIFEQYLHAWQPEKPPIRVKEVKKKKNNVKRWIGCADYPNGTEIRPEMFSEELMDIDLDDEYIESMAVYNRSYCWLSPKTGEKNLNSLSQDDKQWPLKMKEYQT